MAAATIVVLIAVGIYLFNLPTQPSSTNKRTIAVLPFTNLSGNQEYEYFTDGIMEDILTQLSKIGELTVISRTTMMQYKGIKKTLKEIGKELNAGIALEGSVRRSGNRIRISSQLIDAESDKHLWAETYDREMQDVFVVQSDVAQKIANALEIKVTPKEKRYIEKKSTDNTEAYDYYLKGRECYSRYKKDDNEEAIGLFKKAITLDPNFASAWAGLGDAYAQRYIRFNFPHNWSDSALKISKKAIEIDMNSAEAYKALGLVYLSRRLIDSSLAANLKAVEINPNYGPSFGNICACYSILGEFSKELLWAKRAVKSSPTMVMSYAIMGDIYRKIGKYEQAEQAIKKASNLQLDNKDVYPEVIYFYLSQGKDQEVNELMKNLVAQNSNDPDRIYWAGYVAAVTGDFAKAKEYYQRELSIRYSGGVVNDSAGDSMLGYILLKEGQRARAEKIFASDVNWAEENIRKEVQGGMPEYTLAMVSSMRGLKEKSHTYLQKAIERGILDWQLTLRDPRFENIRNDEEFKKLIAQMKAKVDEQRKLIEQMEKEESQ